MTKEQIYELAYDIYVCGVVSNKYPIYRDEVADILDEDANFISNYPICYGSLGQIVDITDFIYLYAKIMKHRRKWSVVYIYRLLFWFLLVPDTDTIKTAYTRMQYLDN